MTTLPQMPPYCLIAIDLDGTLIGSEGVISARNRVAIARARAAGVLVTLVTGRTFSAVRAIAQDLGLTTPVIICNGAEIRHPTNGQTLLHRPIPAWLTRQIIGYLRQRKFSPVAFVDSALYSDQPIPASISPRSGLGGMSRHILGETLEDLALAPDKIAVIVPESKVGRLGKKLSALWEGKIMLSHPYPTLLEVTHHTSSKGRALRWLAKYLGVPRHQVMAVGDGDNDMDMLRWAGLGVAMGNAPPFVRTVSDYVTDSVEADGLAQVIERFLILQRDMA